MSVRRQVPSLCKPYSFNEEVPEKFVDETDVNSFHHKIFVTFARPSIEWYVFAKVPTKNVLQSSCSNFAI